jgi:uncharacterized protein
MKKIISFFLFLFVVVFSLSAQEVAVPQIHERVTDFTNTLSYSEWQALELQLKTFEDSTSNQVIVLMIPTIGENDIRDFGIKVAEQNKIGAKGKDNGVLLLIAKDDKKMTIEVGYGLEGVLPDALCDQIIRHEIRPRFQQGDFFGGIQSGITAIMQATMGEYKASPRSNNVVSWGALLLTFGIFFVLFSSLFTGGRRYGISSRGYRRSSYWGGWGGGGFFGGGGFGGGGFGSSGGFGGFSGGGGGFGGGGASGGW